MNLWLHACNVENGNYAMGEHKNRSILCRCFQSSIVCVCGDSRSVFPIYVVEIAMVRGV